MPIQLIYLAFLGLNTNFRERISGDCRGCKKNGENLQVTEVVEDPSELFMMSYILQLRRAVKLWPIWPKRCREHLNNQSMGALQQSL